MKVLVAIESGGLGWRTLPDNILRWAARGGYDMRIFVKKRQLANYIEAVEDAKYNWYLDIEHDQIITNTKPMEYAAKKGYDLLLRIPDSLTEWRKRGDTDKQVFYYAQSVGKTRVKFGKQPNLKVQRFANGAIMERVRS